MPVLQLLGNGVRLLIFCYILYEMSRCAKKIIFPTPPSQQYMGKSIHIFKVENAQNIQICEKITFANILTHVMGGVQFTKYFFFLNECTKHPDLWKKLPLPIFPAHVMGEFYSLNFFGVKITWNAQFYKKSAHLTLGLELNPLNVLAVNCMKCPGVQIYSFFQSLNPLVSEAISPKFFLLEMSWNVQICMKNEVGGQFIQILFTENYMSCPGIKKKTDFCQPPIP